ncbi:hypothetical protein CC86DRAFT_212514 [Ophiobolus disseminans]|uniref:Uncharacterized protein n=1 Tax=Ophiobolus disseminans TaxID=1469910 RepID=A0A6A7A4D9_9PLEO|nr:hypothetical protein CC86DRAFT_212514 [Ophiobolus disseminans]
MVPFRRISQRGRRSFEERNPHEWNDERDTHIMTATFPIHPLSSMQAPFEESMLDATGETGFVPFQNPNKSVKQRQQMLCREEGVGELSWNFTYNCHWRHHPKGKYHPLVKIVTQIVFGVHLLHQHLEKSVADVADILLKHVNELDGFMQRANEDLESSLKDMFFRHKCLKVPMEHVKEFDRLLEDRAYRAQLLDGNVTIERTITRMSQMLNDYLIDISIFREANNGLDLYLLNLGEEWTYHNEDVGKIYSAMCGNTGGWSQFLQSLVAKAERLGVVLVQVSSYCNEIEKRCGAASRRSLIATRSSSRNSSNSRDHGFRNATSNKDLPPVPSERPPFLIMSNSGNATPAEAEATQRHRGSRPMHHDQNHIVASPGRSGTPQRRESTSSGSPVTEVDARNRNVKPQAQYYQEAWHSEDQRGRTIPQADSGRTSRMFGHRRNASNRSTEEPLAPTSKRVSTKMERGELSPPLTGKDSAYSSVSGASPTALPSRSTSVMSSHPQAQFGLFPSSARSTPKGSISGRFGAMSPALSQPPRSARSSAPPSRPETAVSNFSDASSKRLSKRSSFTSLKRFFTKKRSDINSIPE